MKQNRRLHIPKENDVPHTRHVDARRQQIFRRGDDVRPLPPAQLRNQGLAVHGGHALEGVGLDSLLFVSAAPLGIKVVEFVGHEVRVMIARTKDDRLLQRIAL